MTWQTKKLGEFIKLEYGKPLPKAKRKASGKYPVYGANGVKTRSDTFYSEQSSIIVGRKGSAGELNLTDEKFWPLDVTYYVTFDNKKLNRDFLYHLLGSLELTKLAKGVKPGLNRNEVYSIDVAIPPLSEQKRIIKILSEMFEKVAKAMGAAEKNLQNSKELFESYLQSVFANPEKDWEKKKLGEVSIIVMGQSPKGDTYNTKGVGLPLINGPVEFGKGQLSETHITKYTDKPTKVCKKGALILCVRGSTTGKTNIAGQNSCLGRGVASITAKNNVINQNLLNIYIASMRNTIFKLGTGSTFPNVSSDILSSIKIAFPPFVEQKAIVKKLDTLSTETKKLEKIYGQKLANLEELKRSVLNTAFKGEF